MLDASSRKIIADRVIEDRLAEVRRNHLLRADRAETPAFASGGPVKAGPSFLERVAAALRIASAPAHGRPAYR